MGFFPSLGLPSSEQCGDFEHISEVIDQAQEFTFEAEHAPGLVTIFKEVEDGPRVKTIF